ncbi:MAG: GldG family protein [bacterium]|nr:GldG family protein [Labilithrix sp.]MCW5893349.1 GldG family protein [bacterium]
MERKKKAATESGAMLFILAAIVVAVNTLSYFMYWRKDMTKAEKYTLSEGSGRLIRSIKDGEKIEVEAYVTRGLPKLDAFVRDLRDLLQQYKEKGGGKFDYTIIEPKTEEERKKAEEAGLQKLQRIEGSDTEDKAEVAQGYMGLVFTYKTQREKIPVLSPDNNTGLEFWITNKIRELKDAGDKTKHKLGVLTGHDELKLSDANLVPGGGRQGGPTIQGIIGQYFPFYEIKEVDLKNGDAEVDEELDGLLITQPGKDLSEKELRRIDQFVMRGKSLAVLASAVNVKAGDPTMNATLDTHGLEKLLDGYGIVMNKDVVLEFGRPFRVRVDTLTGPRTMIFPQVLDVREDSRFTGDEVLLDTSFAAFFRIPQASFPFASSLTLKKDKQPQLGDKLRVIARSTPAALTETGDTVDLKPARQWRPKGNFQQHAIAATAEGKLKTAFPEGDKMGVETPAEASNNARVLVISSAQFFANPFVRSGQGPDLGQMGMMMPGGGGDEFLNAIAGPYVQLIGTTFILQTKNLLDWMTGDVDLLAASAKILMEPNLAYGDVVKPKAGEEMTEEQLKKEEDRIKKERKTRQYWIEGTMTLGIPLVFAGLGLVLWRIREARRQNVDLLAA